MTASSSHVPLPPDRRPPWRPRASTQILFLVVTLACMGFAYSARHFRAYLAHQRDRETAQLFEAYGGKTRYLEDTKRAFCLEFEPTERVMQDDGMPLLAQMDGLEYVDLRRTAITDRGLKQLYNLPRLRCVRLDLHSLSQPAVEELIERMPELRVEPKYRPEWVSVGGFRAICIAMQQEHGPLWEGSLKARMPAKVLPYLGEIEHLTTLDLSNSKAKDSELYHLEKLPDLQVLKLDATGLTDLCLPYLVTHRDLRELYLLDTKITRTGIDYLFEQLPQDCRVHWIAGRFRKGNPARSIDIFAREPTADYSSVEWFETRSDLVRLQIIDNHIKELYLDQLGNAFANLQELELYRMGLTADHTVKPGPLDSLRFLRLNHCDLDDGVLKFIAMLPSLEVLVLSHTNLTDAGLAELDKISTLVEIDLSGTQVSDEAIEQFRQAVPSCAVLSWPDSDSSTSGE